ncbi:MAG: aldehyde dehydrogenase family protein [Actinobacteria bacterium]|nr:aldehyde dehydrogenase family protein [Actinomycetota bacterium]
MSGQNDTAPSAERVDDLLGGPAVLLIGDEWVDAESGATFPTTNPATEETLAEVAEAGDADVERAVGTARKAFEAASWRDTSPADRAVLLRRFAELIARDADDLARLETLDSGMTLPTAEAMIAGAIETVLHFAGAAHTIHGVTPQSGGDAFNYSLRDPVGVVASIVPWNAPITNAVWKLSPALAAGNTVILKPAELTPLTALRLGRLVLEAGFPPGVVNVLPGMGEGAGSALAAHPGVDKVSFTGSTEVGKLILAVSGSTLKHVSLELGGKTPNIVFADANLEAALPVAVAAFTSLSGQICTAGSRLFVQRAIHDEFAARLSAAVGSLTVGDPTAAGTDVGPLISAGQRDRVAAYLATGKEAGATASAGGAVIEGRGFFVEPTVFTGVENSMRIAREEIFGPVVSVIPFDDEEEAVRLANETDYGLAAALWTRDLGRAHRLARRLEAGTVWVNKWGSLDPTMPFGGYKQSGLGREFGLDWYQAYTENKAVYIAV